MGMESTRKIAAPTRWGTVMIAALAALASAMPAQAIEPDFTPPEGFLHNQDFEGVHGIPRPWEVALGTWQADGQTYNSTSAASSAITTMFEYQVVDPASGSTPVLEAGVYSLRARLRNERGGANTLVGLVYLYADPATYDEVVFSPTGVAQLRHVVGRTFDVLKSASHTVGRNVWFEVEFVHRGGDVSVSINGEPVFTREPTPLLQFAPPSALALIAHWSPGKFDDFSFSHDQLTPSLRTFDAPLAQGEVRSGTWNTQGETLNSVAVGIADIVLPEGLVGQSDYRFKGRLLNQYGASGNLVGLIFSYNSPEDYLEPSSHRPARRS